MNKKLIIISIFAIFMTATLSVGSVNAKFVESEVSLKLDSQIDEPIEPSETKEVEITVKYKLDYQVENKNIDDLLNWLALKRRIPRALIFGFDYFKKSTSLPDAIIDLSVEEAPEWCTATIEPINVSIMLDNEFNEEKAKLKITVDEDAPALVLSDIVVKAKFANENWQVGESENQTSFTVMAAYEPDITYAAETDLKIPPVNTTTIQINITNSGNGETEITALIEGQPSQCNASLDLSSITVPVGETKQILLTVEPDANFENETINLKFTSKFSSNSLVADEHLKEQTYSLSITVKDDGSQDKDSNGIPGFELFCLLVAIGVIFILTKRRK